MWPWGHLAFGYLLYSLGSRLAGRRVGGRELLVLAVGTQFPDLLDKPLAWTFDVIASGYGVGHAALVALPGGLLLVTVAWQYGDARLGVAFCVGWWSHLAGDVLVAVVLGLPYATERVLWPLVAIPADDGGLGALAVTVDYLRTFLASLSSGRRLQVVLLYTGPLVGALALWLLDGCPGLASVVRTVRRTD